VNHIRLLNVTARERISDNKLEFKANFPADITFKPYTLPSFSTEEQRGSILTLAANYAAKTKKLISILIETRGNPIIAQSVVPIGGSPFAWKTEVTVGASEFFLAEEILMVEVIDPS
jgi:hypothetical protein